MFMEPNLKPAIGRIELLAFFVFSAAIGVAATYAATHAWGPALAAGVLQSLLLRIAMAVTTERSRLVPRPARRTERKS